MPGTNQAPPQPDRWIDYVIDNRYRVTERIGRGGMGSVYKVVHTQIGKVAALKLLHGNLVGDKELIKRFHREAEAISKLNHPNIVQVFDFGRVEETIYLVMEYLKGEDLSSILRRDGPLGFQRSASILIQICDALTEAHDLSIIHRDLKPENVRIARTKDGQDFVKVMDFGLAKMLHEEDKDPAITAKGNLVGTPYYMAPELIRGHDLDHRCDIYSVGAMAYRMLTGENAFMANTPVGVLTKHITDELTPPSKRAPEQTIGPEVDAVVLKAMAKDPTKRFQTAEEMKRDLCDLLGLSPRGVQQPSSSVWRAGSPSAPTPVITPHRRESDNMTFSQRAELGELPTGRIPEGSVSADTALAKEDLAFQRKLKWSISLKALLLAIPLLIAVSVLVYWFGLRQGDLLVPPNEIEPNNTPDKATPILPGKLISGHLGQRVSANESDRDWYKLKIEGTGPQMISAKLTPIPNMDITLGLYDATAGRITGVDTTGKGGGEVISNWTVDPGRHYLLVREVWAVDVPPTENVTDAYRLVVKVRPHDKGWEMEPNELPRQASKVPAGSTFRGYLGTLTDRDTVRVTSKAGFLAGLTSGIAGVDLVLEVKPNSASKPIVIDEEGPSSGERFDGIMTDGKEPVTIQLRRKTTPKKASSGVKPPGLDVPYSLKIWLKPAK